MKKNVCKGAHQGHLCVLAGREDIGGLKALVAPPRFICFNCGRVARRKKNLCNPMALEQDGA